MIRIFGFTATALAISTIWCCAGLRRADAPPHVDALEADALRRELLHTAVRGLPVDPPAKAAAGNAAEQDVFRDAEVGHQVGVLGHHADAELLAAQRARDRLRLTAEANLARVGPHRAGQDARERALARAVLADNGVHFAGSAVMSTERRACVPP